MNHISIMNLIIVFEIEWCLLDWYVWEVFLYFALSGSLLLTSHWWKMVRHLKASPSTLNLYILTLTLKAFPSVYQKDFRGLARTLTWPVDPNGPITLWTGKWAIILLGMRAVNLTCNTSRPGKCTGGGVVLRRCVQMREFGFFLWFKGPISSRSQGARKTNHRETPTKEGNDLTLSLWILPLQVSCTTTSHFNTSKYSPSDSLGHTNRYLAFPAV